MDEMRHQRLENTGAPLSRIVAQADYPTRPVVTRNPLTGLCNCEVAIQTKLARVIYLSACSSTPRTFHFQDLSALSATRSSHSRQ